MKSDELQAWLRWNWLKERIISYEYRRIRILERILRDEKADGVKRLLALIGLTQFALRSPKA
jgi:hypothetical protein